MPNSVSASSVKCIEPLKAGIYIMIFIHLHTSLTDLPCAGPDFC